MTTDTLPSLFPEQEERTTPPGRGEHGYYRRGRDGSTRAGWIMTGGVWPAYRADMEFKGYRFLSEYGTFTYGTPTGETNKDRRGVGFNAISEPWRLLFQAGGAKEFPISQIVAYHWHIRPPYREVVFPQLEGITLYDYFCPECEKGIFSSPDKQEAVDQLRTHLTSAFNDQHSYRPEDLRALGEEYGIDFFAPRRGRRDLSTGQVINDPDAVEMTSAEHYVCKDCGAEFDNRSDRMRHGKECPAKATATEPVSV